MIHEAIENILPRNEREEIVERHKEYSALIEEYVNFGTHMMYWDATSCEGEGDEFLVPLLFLRKSLELGDAISVLVKNSCIDAAKPVLRSLLENTFGLEYLLEKDYANRSLSYIVWNTHEGLKNIEKFDNRTPSGKQMMSALGKDKLFGKLENRFLFLSYPAAFKKQNDEALLKLPKYVPIEIEYQKTKRELKKKNKKPSWHSFFEGPVGIIDLAKYLDLHAFYEIFYRDLSGYVHASNSLNGKLYPNANGNADIIQIRDPRDAHVVTQYARTFLQISCITYIKKRLPSKTEEFGEWQKKVSELYPGF